MESTPLPDARFWASVVKHGDGCWTWERAKRNGYGRLCRTVAGERRWFQAHHITWCSVNGPIPSGMELDHTCHDPNVCSGGECPHRACVNPDHIRAVPHVVNVRAAVRDRCPAGHRLVGDNLYVNPNAKGGRACRTCRSARRAEEKQRARDRKRLGLGPGKPGRPRRFVT